MTNSSKTYFKITLRRSGLRTEAPKILQRYSHNTRRSMFDVHLHSFHAKCDLHSFHALAGQLWPESGSHVPDSGSLPTSVRIWKNRATSVDFGARRCVGKSLQCFSVFGAISNHLSLG